VGLAPERVADRAGRAAGVTRQPRMAERVRGDAAGPARVRHRWLRVRDHRLHGASRPGRRCGAGPTARAPPAAWPAADARLRSQPYRLGSPLGGGPPRVLRPRVRAGPDAGAAELYVGQADAGGPPPRPWARPVLPRLAGYAATRLQQSGDTGGDGRRVAEDRRAM